LVFIVASCTKTTTVPVDESPAVTKTVSFSKDLQPIFTKSCALSGCHGGTVAPDLSASTSYDALVNGNFISTATPSNSLVYLWLTGKEAVAMPAGAANNPSNINALVLAWIKQGAKNN
jgi:type 1 glutamine amidotransferase